MLKAPEIKRLKLKYDEPLSIFAFSFNLRRYSMGPSRWTTAWVTALLFVVVFAAASIEVDTMAGRCRLTL